MFYVYVLKSKKDSELYTDFTNDLRRRIKEHNNKGVKSTRGRVPLVLVYYEAYFSEDDARKRELRLKLRGQARNHLKTGLKSSPQET